MNEREKADRLLTVLNRNAREIWELSRDGGVAVVVFENDAVVNAFASAIGWDGESEVFRLRADRTDLCAQACQMMGCVAAREWFGDQCPGRVLVLVAGSIQPITIDGKGGMIPLEPWRFMPGVAN